MVTELTASLGLETKAWEEGLILAKTKMDTFIQDIEKETIDFKKLFTNVDEQIISVKSEIEELWNQEPIPIKVKMDETSLAEVTSTIKELKVFFNESTRPVIDSASSKTFQEEKLTPRLEREFGKQPVSLKELSFDVDDTEVTKVTTDIEEKIKPKLSIDAASVSGLTKSLMDITSPTNQLLEKIDDTTINLEMAFEKYQATDMGGDVNKLASAVVDLKDIVMKLAENLYI